MTRKHFIALAAIVRQQEDRMSIFGRYELASELADFCAQHNSNFDRNRFMDACGV